MEFKKYQHIERLGTTEVQGIMLGECSVFYKVDGTNASCFLGNDGTIKAGNRTRELTLEKDNAGFYAYVLSNENIKNYLEKHPNHRLFGEFLTPHSLKTYRDDAWRKFYIFDVCLDRDDGEVEYLPYNVYKNFLDEFHLDYIPPLAVVKNGTYETFVNLLDKSGQFLVKDGHGIGEGIVLKRYDWYNKYGRQVWGKIISNEFKEIHHKEMGCPSINTPDLIEEKIVEKYCTAAFIEKEYSKIVTQKEGWRSQYIPMLLGTVFYELVREESWNFVKKFKMPTINYKTLNMMTTRKIKEVKSNLFA